MAANTDMTSQQITEHVPHTAANTQSDSGQNNNETPRQEKDLLYSCVLLFVIYVHVLQW